MKMKARVIAFYLPQFHAIPENDKWWGKGFTEWTSVKNAKPLFEGHVEPKVPGELGYYNLLDPQIRERQAELAKSAGIEGFCYWHYWFGNGKRLLEKPFHEVLTSGKPDYPFCLCWANHTWARTTWVNISGNTGKQILMEQTYPGDEDIIMHFNACLPAFKDPRYIRVDNKPLFGVWAPLDIPNFEHFKDLWNKMARENGIDGIHFVGLTTDFRQIPENTMRLGYDALCLTGATRAMRRTSFWKNSIIPRLRKVFPNHVFLTNFPYEKIIENWFKGTRCHKENYYPCVFPNYDRSPRGGVKAVLFYGSTPALWKKHLQQAIEIVKNKEPQHRLIFIRSWNEWGEGNYLEPDAQFGTQYLDVMHDLLK
ncbi:lipopolysaccharide biosynthesis protein [Prevotellaceae bacterium LKV-178-WT-2A]|uniref:Lipopolysaccharide biosynthesis protein n=2 Tax=Hallella mizrahii TaxID=2606637 RepID=A0A7K0KIU3_9BACT|nr:lipopolysaccharide biosynthesis protein [Hallella mizrahii]